MTDETFAMVRRGYDPTQVDSVLRRMRQSHAAALQESATQTVEINDLNQALETAQQEVASLKEKIADLEDQANNAQAQAAARTTDFSALGERIGKILNLAQTEADDILDRAKQDANAMQAQKITMEQILSLIRQITLL